MISSHRSLFRIPGASLRAAAALVLTATVAGACSSSGDEDPSRTAQDLSGGSPCDGVQLDASRSYKPRNSWSDADVQFPVGQLTFQVPSEIPVTQGDADHGKVTFTFSLDGGTPTTCIYRGSHSGNKYVLTHCRRARDWRDWRGWRDCDDDDDDTDGPSDPNPHAGSTVTADSFTLHVNRGKKKAGKTAVSLHIGGPVISDNDACTTDACTPGSGVTHTAIDIDDHNACTTDACNPATGPSHTLVDSPVCRGEVNFHDEDLTGLGGNGRACSTCHVPSDAFQLTPSHAEARFQALQAARVTDPAADDPLFRPIDADDFRTNGAAASNYSNLRQRGLVRVSIPLPANIRLLDCGSTLPCPPTAQPTSETHADVWRATPSVFNVNATGPDTGANTSPRTPNQRGGYQLDARVDTLQNQALGALRNHASVTVDPPLSWLNDVTAFQNALVTPAEPALNALEQQGKDIFNRACATCHGGDSTSTPQLAPAGWPSPNPRYHDIASQFPRPVDTVSPARWVFTDTASQLAGNVRTYEITFADGFKLRRSTTDPGRALLTGFVFSAPPPVAPAVCAHPPCGPGPQDDWQKFDTAPLRGIAKTAPYFHNNSAATLEAVLDHYDVFFTRVTALIPTASILSTTVPGTGDRPVRRVSQDGGAERAALLAYLNKL
jgi:mono/diheme cytochrome c family protein